MKTLKCKFCGEPLKIIEDTRRENNEYSCGKCTAYCMKQCKIVDQHQ